MNFFCELTCSPRQSDFLNGTGFNGTNVVTVSYYIGLTFANGEGLGSEHVAIHPEAKSAPADEQSVGSLVLRTAHRKKYRIERTPVLTLDTYTCLLSSLNINSRKETWKSFECVITCVCALSRSL